MKRLSVESMGDEAQGVRLRRAQADERRCNSDACWCSTPPVRRVPSTGALYSVRQVASVDGPRTIRVFVYSYREGAL